MPRLAPMFPGMRWPLLVPCGSRISSMRAPAVMRHNGARKLVGRFFRRVVRSTERELLPTGPPVCVYNYLDFVLADLSTKFMMYPVLSYDDSRLNVGAQGTMAMLWYQGSLRFVP